MKISIKKPKDWATSLRGAKIATEEGEKHFNQLNKLLKREKK